MVKQSKRTKLRNKRVYDQKIDRNKEVTPICRAFKLTGDEGLSLHNFKINLVIALHALSLLFWHFLNTTAYHLGRHEPSSTKELHDLEKVNFMAFGWAK